MTLSLAALLLQGGSVPLTLFTDDGGTKTHALPPQLFPLKSVGAARTATLRLGDRRFRVEIRRKGAGVILLVDGAAQPWRANEGSLPDGAAIRGYDGRITLPVGAKRVAYEVRYLESATKDSGFAPIRDHLMVRPLFGFTGTARFGPRSYRFAIRGGDPSSAPLFVDRDGDGRYGTVQAELFDAGTPFNLDGRSYRLASLRVGGRSSVAVAPSTQRVEEVFMPPDLGVGKIAPQVPGKTLAGKPIVFPKGFPGRLVLLDVWATWCGPCRAEIPYLRDAYARFRGRGLEIVSMSIDDAGMRGQVTAFARAQGETWTQAYEGKGWASYVCRRYAIKSIPFVLLVDVTTGRIVANGASLRGPNLAPTVAAALTKRR